MAEPDDAAEVAEEAGEGKSKKGLLLMIIVVVNILFMAGMAAYFFLVYQPGMEAAKADDAAEKEEAATKEVKVGPIVELDPFLVNLDEPGSSRYLRAVIQLEMDKEKGPEEIKTRKVQIRDMIITYLSSLNYSQTQGIVNKEIIRTSLIKQVNKRLTNSQIVNLYFSEFVIQ